MIRRSLFKYYDERKWAEAFMDGGLLFRSLSYFRDKEDRNVRGDRYEGTSVFRPEGGLVMNNHTEGTTTVMKDWAFESGANPEDIFVFCMSRSLTGELWSKFNASVCVEVFDIPAFCTRITAALPSHTRFPQQPGRAAQIGHRVEYYKAADSGKARWALPDMSAVSKLEDYKWQDEFRLVFSLTGAFDFENVNARLVHKDHPREAAKPAEHREYLVRALCLRDICRVHTTNAACFKRVS